MANPLIDDRTVDFILYELLDAESLCRLPYFQDHGRETFDLFLGSCRKLAREALFPAYRPMDREQPWLDGAQVRVHPAMRELWPKMVELGMLNATCPVEVGGQQLPQLINALAFTYLQAANISAAGFPGLTSGAAHLIETFGDEQLKRDYMAPMYEGKWGGTMALTEPQAGSSLADVRTRAQPTPQGHYLISGNKVFISGGDQDITENVVHLALARIDGAAPGIKGVSLFVVPKRRLENTCLVDNDCASAGVFHKLGWRGLPSIALNFGERNDCHGYLVGQAGRGLAQMFVMMNGARLAVGLGGASTASAAFHESLDYAKNRPQGRTLGQRDPNSPQIPILEHADVRRMLLRQKAIVESSLALCAQAALWSDQAEHGDTPELKRHSQLLLDLITPAAKTFPSEKGFESCALALQIFGGYGYTSEYPAESYLRDQKLNTLHEGTTGIQGMDLLGRKALAEGGASLQELAAEMMLAIEAARSVGDTSAPLTAMATQLEAAVTELGATTMQLAQLGMGGDRNGMLLHSADYLELFSTITVAWLWLKMATVAARALPRSPARADFLQGKIRCAAYWFATEVPRVASLAQLIKSGEGSYDGVTGEMLG